MTHEQ